jgi:hypothetical protein
MVQMTSQLSFPYGNGITSVPNGQEYSTSFNQPITAPTIESRLTAIENNIEDIKKMLLAIMARV